MLSPRTVPFGLGMRRGLTPHPLHTRCYVREELDSTPLELFGSAGPLWLAKFSCDWLSNIGYGLQTEGRGITYKIKFLNAFYVTKRRTRWTTFCCNVCSRGKFGSLAFLGWGCPRSFAQHMILDWCIGGRTLESVFLSTLERGLILLSCSSDGCYGNKGMRGCLVRARSRMSTTRWT